MAERPISLAEAKGRYSNRYTMEHVPAWAAGSQSVDGIWPAPQYRSDQEWYDLTLFPGEGDIPRNAGYCSAIAPTWPLGQTLDRPYRVGQTPPETEPPAVEPRPLKDSAMRRLYKSGLTIAQAINMGDNDLLAHPRIGRKTLRWVRSFQILE